MSITSFVVAGIAAHCRTMHRYRRREWQVAYLITTVAVVLMAYSMATVAVPPKQVRHANVNDYEPGEFVEVIDRTYEETLERVTNEWYARQNTQPANQQRQL